MSDAIVKTEAEAVVVQHPSVPNEWGRERVELLKRTYCAGASDLEFQLFVSTCQRLRLSPEAKQIWSVPKGGVRHTMVSIDGLRLIAERSGRYAGQTEPQWCGPDGEWKSIWLDKQPPYAARVGVHRSDFREPLYRVAKYSAFTQSGPMWQKMADHMLAKVAEALALRAAFPNECSGVYTDDEMAQEVGPESRTAKRLEAASMAKPKAPTTVKFHPDFLEASGLVRDASKEHRQNYLCWLDERSQATPEGQKRDQVNAHADAVHRIAEDLGDYTKETTT